MPPTKEPGPAAGEATPPRRRSPPRSGQAPKRPESVAEARRLNAEQLARLGGELRATRKRQRLTQEELGNRVGRSQAWICALELGRAGACCVETLQTVAVALGRPLRLELQRDPREEPVDAGHLRVQELILRLARPAGYLRSFEVPTRPSDPWRSADVGLRNDEQRRLVLVEAWNTITDIGAAARSTNRKLAEAQAYATTWRRVSGTPCRASGWCGPRHATSG